MNKRKQNKPFKTNKKQKKQYRRLVVLFAEIFLLVVIVGVFLLWSLKPEQEQPQHVIVMEETIPELTAEEVQEERVEEITNSRYGAELADTAYCKENHIYAKEALREDEVILAFAGDVSFAEGYANMAALLQRDGEIQKCFDEFLLMEMHNADIFMVNNEFTYTDRGAPTEGKTYTFRAKPESVKYLGEMGVDIVSLANNHAYDYGEVSLLDTLDVLKKAKVPYVGAGRDIEEAMKPTYFVVNDIKIAYVSATQIEQGDNPDTVGAGENTAGVFRCWNNDRICEVVKEAKTNADFVVVYVHWGTESTDVLHWAQVDQAAKLVEAGAHLIVGDHPHCLQEIAYVDSVPVIYSMGNFWFNSKTQDTGILKATINEEGLQSLQFVPSIQSGCKTTIAPDGERERILDYIQSLSSTITIDNAGYITKR